MGGNKKKTNRGAAPSRERPAPPPAVERGPVLWVVGDGKADGDYLRRSLVSAGPTVPSGASRSFEVQVAVSSRHGRGRSRRVGEAELDDLAADDAGDGAAVRVARAWRPGDVVAVLVPGGGGGAALGRCLEWLQPVLDRVEALPEDQLALGDWFRAVALLRHSAACGGDAAALADRLRPAAVCDVASLELTRDDCKRALDAALLDRSRLQPLSPAPAPPSRRTPIEDRIQQRPLPLAADGRVSPAPAAAAAVSAELRSAEPLSAAVEAAADRAAAAARRADGVRRAAVERAAAAATVRRHVLRPTWAALATFAAEWVLAAVLLACCAVLLFRILRLDVLADPRALLPQQFIHASLHALSQSSIKLS